MFTFVCFVGLRSYQVELVAVPPLVHGPTRRGGAAEMETPIAGVLEKGDGEGQGVRALVEKSS